MRKKSHISVARLIVNSMDHSELRRHWKAFYLGSILPDCKPSFITKRHEYKETFDDTATEIRKLSGETEEIEKDSGAYFRRLGEVLHFLADYFTFPHNDTYQGNLRDHCIYEKHLKNYLKEYIDSGRAVLQERQIRIFQDVEGLLEFIKASHREYMKLRHSVERDTRYIIRLCQQAVYGILQLLEKHESEYEMVILAAG